MYLRLITKILSIRLSLSSSVLQFVNPFFFSFLFLKDRHRASFSYELYGWILLNSRKNMACICVRAFPWQAVERKSSKQYYLTVKVSPR